MQSDNLLDSGTMISGRQAYKYWKISDHAFFAAVKQGVLQPQMIKQISNRTEGQYAIGYLDEIAPLLPKKRGKGVVVFTDETIEKIKLINKSWKTRTIDFEQDSKDTNRVISTLQKKHKR